MTGERGTAAIEFAMAFVVLLLIAIGTYELGTAFVDRNAMANAAREGARAGTAAGDFDDTSGGGIDADCVVIEAAAGALQGMDGNQVQELWIFKSNPSGDVGDSQVYRVPGMTESPDLNCGGADWILDQNGWPPSQRDLGSEQWLGVRIIVDHSWKTGFLLWEGDTTWQEDVVMRIEPAPE